MSKISEAIIRLRTEKGLTQQDLADQLLVSRSLVSMWELGERTPDILSVEKMSELFGVDEREVLPDTRYVFASGENEETAAIEDEIKAFTEPETLTGTSSADPAAALDAFLSKQSREDRALFMSRFLMMKTYKTIADEFGMNESTARSRIARMRSRFGQFLAKEESR